jgi:GWxTD domain-containing protein
MRRVRGLLLSFVLGASAWAQTDLAEKHRKWLEEEVVYIITEAERGAFVELRSAEERDAFIEAFWRKRDPDPLTEVNEFREEHYRRIEHANRVLGRETPIPGWRTDRGKMYILLGEPREREAFPSAPGMYPAEVWFYEANRAAGLSSPFYLLFFQQGFAGEYRLYSPRIHGPEKLFPAWQFDENSRMEAYEMLQNISAELAHASITFRADESAIPGILHDSLSTDILLADINRSPQRGIDTRYVDAIANGRGLVETDYLFNHVPSEGSVDVLPGPEEEGGISFVHWGIEIEPQHFTLVFDESRKVYYTSLEIQGEITTADTSVPVLRFGKEEFLELSPSQFQGVQARPFAYRSMSPLVPGKFHLRVILKNRARSQYTLLESEFAVPSGLPGDVRLGAPVLLHGAEASPSPNYGPYQLATEKLDPNARRVYAVGQDLWALVPLRGAAPDQRLTLRLIDRETGAAASEPTTISVSDWKGKPILERLPLAGLPNGRYRLDLALQDSSGAALGSSAVDFDVSPRTSVPRPWSLRWAGLDVSVPGVIETALAEQHLRLDHTAEAKQLYETALAKNSSLMAPRLVLARYHLDEGHAANAIELLTPLLATQPENPELRRTLGDAYFQNGDPREALPHLEKALELTGTETALLNALGSCHARLGNREKAIAFLEQSLAAVPDQENIRALVKQLKTASH